MKKLILSANKTEVQQKSVYFWPGVKCLEAIISHIRSTKNRIKICLFTISDDRTRSAERYDHENILVTDSKMVVRQFDKEFDSLWDEFPDL